MDPLSTGFTLQSTGVDRVRYEVFNFNGTDKIIFVDGVNPATIYDGIAWTQVRSTKSGSSFANAGGDQAIDAPRYVSLFKNHIFVSNDPNFADIIAHSAPSNEYDWTAASGAGQLNAGFEIRQIYPFRDMLFVFGEVRIKNITVNGTTFVINDVATNIGCIAPDSVVEINGDLLFLAQDGFRPISATMRLNDIELGSVSKDIQQDVITLSNLYAADTITGVVIRQKSQVRFFFSTASTDETLADGVIGGLRGSPEGVQWEWGRLRGIKVACCTSGYIGKDEYVIHGDYQGRVYRQEVGASFDGRSINAVYATPFIDFGESQMRKTIRTINVFTRPEGPVEISMGLNYDWGIKTVHNPPTYELRSSGSLSTYGDAIYGQSTYGGAINPIMISNVEGSGFSVQLVFHTNDTSQPYTIQGIVFEYSIDGRQ